VHAFARNIARDGDVLGFAGDFINLINIDYAALRPFDIVIGVLQQPQDDVLDVFAHVAGLGEGGGISDGERHVEHLGQRAGQQRLARPVGPIMRILLFSISTSVPVAGCSSSAAGPSRMRL
jgi:hypothetical protein